MKYLKASVPLLFLFSMYFSCTESPIKEGEDKLIYEPQFPPFDYSMEPPINKISVAGIYKGTFPCTDCDGMKQILFLKDNFTYKQAYINVDSNKEYSTSKGKWKIEGNRIILSKKKENYISFFQREDSLFAMDIDQIPLRNPEIYGLGKQEYAGDQSYWKGEKKKGVSFAGRGSEPYWILNIKNNIIYFKLHNRKNVLVSEKGKTESSDNQTTYYLTTNNNNWSVTIKDHFCTYGLSENIYEYEVVVNYNGNEYFGCGIDLNIDSTQNN